jgi:hypothetical protein
MAGERRTILHAGFLTVTCHSRQVQQQIRRALGNAFGHGEAELPRADFREAAL